MTIHIVCPSCGTKMHAPDDKAGAQAKCRNCKATIVIPSPRPTTPKTAEPLVPFLRTDAVEVEIRSRREDPLPISDFTDRSLKKEVKECPFCGEEVLAVAKKCKHCHETIDVALRAAEEAKRAAERKDREQPMVFMNAGGGSSSSGSQKSGSLHFCPKCGNDILFNWLGWPPWTCANCGKSMPMFGWPKRNQVGCGAVIFALLGSLAAAAVAAAAFLR